MIALFLNGETPLKERMPKLANYAQVFCTDGAYNYLHNFGIEPDYVCGDFDSISAQPPAAARQHLPDQNFTDFEKTLVLIVSKNIGKTVHVFGASGKEMDHFLGNLSVAKANLERLNLVFFDNYKKYWLATSSQKFSAKIGESISIIPFPKGEGINLKGLKYSAENATFELASAIGIRNEAIAEKIEITLKSGCIAIFKDYDEIS